MSVTPTPNVECLVRRMLTKRCHTSGKVSATRETLGYSPLKIADRLFKNFVVSII